MMSNEDLAYRASHARHYLLATGQQRHADSITELLAEWKSERHQRELAADHLRQVERSMDEASKELKRVGSLLGLAPGTDILASLYPEIEKLIAKNAFQGRAALDTAFEAMAARLEEVMDENTELVRIIEGRALDNVTTSLGATQN